MLKKIVTLAFSLGLTSASAIASNELGDDTVPVVSVAAAAQDRPSDIELQIEGMREPHRSKLKDWKKNCELLSNYLAFTIGEMNVKAKAKFAQHQATYDQAKLDIALSDRFKIFEALLEELNNLVSESLGLCLENSHADRLTEAEQTLAINLTRHLFGSFGTFSKKFLEAVIYDVWGRSNKLQEYISDTYKTILESEARLEFCTLDEEQIRILNENLKVSRSLYDKYRQFSNVEYAALALPNLWHTLFSSLISE